MICVPRLCTPEITSIWGKLMSEVIKRFSQRKELDQGEMLESRIMKHFQKGGTTLA